MEYTDSIRALLDDKGASVHTIKPDQTVYDAIEHMSNFGIGALVVQEDGKIIGILSERDYARKIVLTGRTSRDALVREIMTENVIVAAPSDTVGVCMQLLSKNQIRHLPIVDEEQVIGIITSSDLVKWIINRQNETIEHLEHYIAGGYVH